MSGDPLATVTIHGLRPGYGPNWQIDARDATGKLLMQAIAPRDVAVAAFAEWVEALHGVDESYRGWAL